MKVIAVGRNYLEHARELEHEVSKVPVIFLMPETTLLKKNRPFYIPDFSNEIHYEVEVVIRINRVGKYISSKFAHRYYDEIGLGIDFTARDIQRNCIEKGLPWELAKSFDNASPISKFIPKEQFKDVNNLNFHLDINGKRVQQDNTKNMLFSFDEIIAYVSQFFTLKIGDLIFTGTPAGVGPVKIGDKLQAAVEDQLLLDFEVR